MADGLTTTTTVSTIPNATKIATDDAGAAGHVQMVKLAIATDGSATALTADNMDGLLVNLGANNDVTVTSGSITVTQGTATNLKAEVVGTGTFAVQATVAAAATNIAKAEDAASADLDVGVPALAVRKATPANTSGTDGDYEFLQMSAGRLWTSATVDAALPAGTNAIGKLAANSGVDIGDVDVTSVIPGTAATNLGKAEDAGHTTGDVGVMALTVRQNTAAALSGTDADYQPLITDTNGRLHTIDVSRIYYQKQIYGSAQTVINTATDIAAGNFSGAPAAAFDNTSDTVIPYAPYAQAMLEAPDWAAAPVAGTTVDLYGIVNNVDGTDDDTDAPSGTSAGGARYFGSFYIAARDDGAVQRRTINISLLGINSTVDFYIKNGTAQNMNNDAGTNCVVKITPFVTAQVG